MAKIEKVKTDLIEFEFFPASSVFLEYKREHGQSFQESVKGLEMMEDAEPMAKLLYHAYKSACVIRGINPELTWEKIMASLHYKDLSDAWNVLWKGLIDMGDFSPEVEVSEDKKDAKKKV